MPLFEFRCLQCHVEFEALVRPATADTVCPSCGRSDLRKLLSMFAVGSEATRAVALTSGRRRAAKEQRDNAIAEQEHERLHEH